MNNRVNFFRTPIIFNSVAKLKINAVFWQLEGYRPIGPIIKIKIELPQRKVYESILHYYLMCYI